MEAKVKLLATFSGQLQLSEYIMVPQGVLRRRRRRRRRIRRRRM